MTDWDPEALRQLINRYPPYLGAGIEVTHIAGDGSEVRVEMPLSKSNANVVGTHFGGSLYSMVDPHLMLLLMHRLGRDYVVWDSSATIDFIKPGRGTVTAAIRITEDEVEAIREACRAGRRDFPEWTVEVTDEDDDVVASVRKVLYVRRRDEA